NGGEKSSLRVGPPGTMSSPVLIVRALDRAHRNLFFEQVDFSRGRPLDYFLLARFVGGSAPEQSSREPQMWFGSDESSDRGERRGGRRAANRGPEGGLPARYNSNELVEILV